VAVIETLIGFGRLRPDIRIRSFATTKVVFGERPLGLEPLREKIAALRDFNPGNVRFGSKADVAPCLDFVRFTPKADIVSWPRYVCFVP
jgi:hypothetical protein